ncbi:MAG: class I SAM-dependent methyltransferase, partial [Candidatus Hydrogenedentes bacterium]|nr:class I SAM-dependent methyltransferase [Candidatus Hydrogenedentota bacterium]
MNNSVAEFYRENPRMVSSPFGGVDGLDSDLLRDVFDRLRIDLAGKKVLDVGCGRGFAGDIVREAGGEYTGVDFVSSRDGFRLALGDAARLPFPDALFDVVFCMDAFEHFPDPHRAAVEFRRVLRPGGFFYLSAPNYSNVAGIVKRVYEGLGLYEKNTWAPFGRWQPQELETPL